MSLQHQGGTPIPGERLVIVPTRETEASFLPVRCFATPPVVTLKIKGTLGGRIGRSPGKQAFIFAEGSSIYFCGGISWVIFA